MAAIRSRVGSASSNNPFDASDDEDPHTPAVVSANPFDDDSDSGDKDDAVGGREETSSPRTPSWLSEAAVVLPEPSTVMAATSDVSGVSDNPFGESAAPAAAAPPPTAPVVGNPFAAPDGAPDNPFALPEAPSAAAPGTAVPTPPSPPARPAPEQIEIAPPSFATDMANGCAGLLASGRHADISFELAARTLPAHRCLLEARCGAPLVQALASGLVGTVVSEGGLLRISLPAQVVGDVSGAPLAALLSYIYTERFDPEALAGRGGAIALLRLATRFEAAGPSAALERLRHLCEQEIAAAVVPETVVAAAHQASELGASQLLRFCLESMKVDFAQLHATGGLSELRTELCAALFHLRSTAPLQDALMHGRRDVVEWLLPTASSAASASARSASVAAQVGGAAPDLGSLLTALDAHGRTALEVALEMEDLAAASLLVTQARPQAAPRRLPPAGCPTMRACTRTCMHAMQLAGWLAGSD